MKLARKVRQVSCDTEVGKITTDYRVLDVRRPIWSLGSMMDSGCDVHITKNRCCRLCFDDGKELPMIRTGGMWGPGGGYDLQVSGQTSEGILKSHWNSDPKTWSRVRTSGTGEGSSIPHEALGHPPQEPRSDAAHHEVPWLQQLDFARMSAALQSGITKNVPYRSWMSFERTLLRHRRSQQTFEGVSIQKQRMPSQDH